MFSKVPALSLATQQLLHSCSACPLPSCSSQITSPTYSKIEATRQESLQLPAFPPTNFSPTPPSPPISTLHSDFLTVIHSTSILFSIYYIPAANLETRDTATNKQTKSLPWSWCPWPHVTWLWSPHPLVAQPRISRPPCSKIQPPILVFDFPWLFANIWHCSSSFTPSSISFS